MGVQLGPEFLLLGIYPADTLTHLQDDICVKSFMAALSGIAKDWWKPAFPVVGEWSNRLHNICVKMDEEAPSVLRRDGQGIYHLGEKCRIRRSCTKFSHLYNKRELITYSRVRVRAYSDEHERDKHRVGLKNGPPRHVAFFTGEVGKRGTPVSASFTYGDMPVHTWSYRIHTKRLQEHIQGVWVGSQHGEKTFH